jgi:FAD/FMN-containing dehydrogenase
MTISTVSRAHPVVSQLHSVIRGKVLSAADVSFDGARKVWNGAVDSRPAVIVQCQDQTDVVAALRIAREHGLPLSVRGGGHDWAGRALTEGGLVVDLSPMRGVTVDPHTVTAVAEGGASAGDVVAAARPYGLAPVTGTVKAVGMAGLTLAGGYGPLCGKHGLALDNLLAAEVVLADGRVVTASEDDDADLYWALRGGGGGSGVVSAARYRLHPLAAVLAGLLLFPLDQAPAILGGYREIVADAPDALTVMAGFLGGPDGQPLLFLFPTWSGEAEDGERAIARLKRLGTPALAQVGSMPYQNALSTFDASVVDGRHYALRTRWLSELGERPQALLLDAARRVTSPLSAIAIHHFHGAAARVPSADTAFALREDHLLVEILAAWEPSAANAGGPHREWADAISGELASHSLPGGYPNLLGPDQQARVRLAYGANADRLLELRRRYDPHSAFKSAVGSFEAAAA